MRLSPRLLIGLLAAVTVFGTADYLTGAYQRYLLEEKRRARERLERLVFYGLRMGIEEIVLDQEGRYRMALRLQNASKGDLFVMLPTLSLFLQVGTGWEEVPVSDLSHDEGVVIRLVSDRIIERLATLPRQDFTQLLPGYFHAKITATALVSFRAEPKDDVAEKAEEFFLFLKSWMAEDRTILKALEFADRRIPVYIPLRAPTLIPSSPATKG